MRMVSQYLRISCVLKQILLCTITLHQTFGSFWSPSILSRELWIVKVTLGGFILYSNSVYGPNNILIYLGSTPHPVTVTTRIITFLVGNPYKPSFATGIPGWGVDPKYTLRILTHLPRMVLEPANPLRWRWLDTSISFWQYDWMPTPLEK